MKLQILDVDSAGRLVPEQYGSLPWDTLKLVCVILAHNETGVIQDLTDLSTLCSEHGVPLLVDAVQAVGKIPSAFRNSGLRHWHSERTSFTVLGALADCCYDEACGCRHFWKGDIRSPVDAPERNRFL